MPRAAPTSKPRVAPASSWVAVSRGELGNEPVLMRRVRWWLPAIVLATRVSSAAPPAASALVVGSRDGADEAPPPKPAQQQDPRRGRRGGPPAALAPPANDRHEARRLPPDAPPLWAEQQLARRLARRALRSSSSACMRCWNSRMRVLVEGGLMGLRPRGSVAVAPRRSARAVRTTMCAIRSFLISACHRDRIIGRCEPSLSMSTEPVSRFLKWALMTSRSEAHSAVPSGAMRVIVSIVPVRNCTYARGSSESVHRSASSNQHQKKRSLASAFLPAESFIQSSSAALKATFGLVDGSRASTSFRCITRYSSFSIDPEQSVSAASHMVSSALTICGWASSAARRRSASSE